jgi:hypothetical protein
MPKYEKIRNRREQASRKLMSATVPKRNIVLAIINSAIFIWFISAIFLTLGGGYVTYHQQCMRDADQIIERHRMINQEMVGRRLAFSNAIEAANTVQKLPSGLTKGGSASVPEFSKMSYFDVQMELVKFGSRIAYEELPDSSISTARLAWGEFNHQQADRLFDDFQKPLDAKPIKIDPNVELRSRKLYLQLFNDFASFEYNIDTYAYYFHPDCAPLKLLGVALGYKPAIVLASISPLYHDIAKSTLAEDIEGFHRLKSDILALNAKSPTK